MKTKEIKTSKRYMEFSDFITWMVTHNYSKRFALNYIGWHPGSELDIIGHIKNVYRGDTLIGVRSIISSAFTWEYATEGYDFWSAVSNEWKEYCKLHEVENQWADQD